MKQLLSLIKKGKAYVCDLSPEEIREYRGTLTARRVRIVHTETDAVEENLRVI